MFNLSIISEGIKLIRDFSNPENANKRTVLRRAIRRNKALNIAEQIFEIIDKNISALPKKDVQRYYHLKRKFNELD